MPTVEERAEKLKAFKDEQVKRDVELFKKLNEGCEEVSNRAADIGLLYRMLQSYSIPTPKEFRYSKKKKNSVGFLYDGELMIVVTVGETPPSLFHWYRERRVSVFKVPDRRTEKFVFHQEIWRGRCKLIYGMDIRDLEVLTERFSKFESDFYTWFDEKFGVKEEKDELQRT